MNIIKKLSFICFLLISINSVYSYSADYPYDIANATYNGDNKDVSAQGASFEDVKWHPNGTSMYALANAADIIFQYTCTDPFNSSSCTYASKSLNGNSEDTNMNEFDFNDDGTKIFMLGNAADTVFQYTCTGAYDLSTCSYASISVSVTATASNPFGMTLNDDGSFLYVADRAGNDINQFKCTTPYTISSCSALGVTLSTLAETGAGLGFGIEWNGNGSSIFQVASGSDDLFQYDCTINYNLSSCSYSGRSFSFTTQETNPLGIAFDSTGAHLYAIGTIQDTVFDYNISFPPVAPPASITTNLSSIYATGNLGVSVTTVSNANMSYSLDSASFVTICNVCNSSSVDLTSVSVGNHNISWRSIDGAGTAYNNETFEIQPFQYFRFNDTDGNNLVTNYTFGGISSIGNLVTLDARNYNQGNQTLEFNKAGYPLTDFVVEFNNSMQVNTTYDITVTTIIINILDRDTQARITNSTTLQLIGTEGANATTTTGTYNFTSASRPNGAYQIVAGISGYDTESLYFTYNNQEEITLNMYLLKSSQSGSLTILVKDTLAQFIETAIVDLLEWRSGENSYVSVAQCSTNAAGECVLNINLNTKVYKFKATKDQSTKTTNSQIITTDGTTLTITLEDSTLTVVETLPNLAASMTETLTGNTSLTRLEWADSDGLVNRACISTYKIQTFSEILLSQNCTSSSSGILFKTEQINNTYDIEIRGDVFAGGIIYPQDQFFHKGTLDISQSLSRYKLDLFMPLFAVFISIAAGIFFGNVYLGLGLTIFSQWILVGFIPAVMTASIATVITVLSGIVLWGVYKR